MTDSWESAAEAVAELDRALGLAFKEFDRIFVKKRRYTEQQVRDRIAAAGLKWSDGLWRIYRQGLESYYDGLPARKIYVSETYYEEE